MELKNKSPAEQVPAGPYFDELRRLFIGAARVKFHRGNILLVEDQDDPFFLVEQGFVKSYHIDQQGNENILCFLGRHDLFPLKWQSLFGDHGLAYEAVSDGWAYKVDKKALDQFLAINSKATIALLSQALKLISLYRAKLVILTEAADSRKRLASLILSLVARHGLVRLDGSVRLELPVYHKELAAALGLTRETVTRALAQLKKDGFITLEGRVLVVPDLKLLQKEAA